MCKEYNGYSNYQTWDVSLWLDNEEYSYHHIRDLAEYEMENRDTGDLPILSLADKIQDYAEEFNPLADEASMFSDLLGHALANVDYYEIAENILEELADQPC
jgi:hypothetical protein